ncbi:MAG: hypothetical protein ACMUIP_02105 [bacterium]
MMCNPWIKRLLVIACCASVLFYAAILHASTICVLGDYTYDNWGGATFLKHRGYIQYFDPTDLHWCPDLEYPLYITSFRFRTQGGSYFAHLWPKYPSVVVYDMADPSDVCVGPGVQLARYEFTTWKDSWDDNIGEFIFPEPLKVEGPFFIGVINVQPQPDDSYFSYNFTMNWCELLLPDCHMGMTIDNGQTWYLYLQSYEDSWQLEWWVEVTGDMDGDGLLDLWEIYGIDINNDGTIDLDLPALGANPAHKDLFVEVDLASGKDFPERSKMMLNRAFKNAPVSNPDGIDGITLHILEDENNLTISEKIVFDATNWAPEFDTLKADKFGTYAERNHPTNSENILEAKKKVYRYCIFARGSTDGTSGRGEKPGNDFFLTLDEFIMIDDNIIAHAFMHELGHTFGLGHGGNDDINYKPNYVSVMNYVFMNPNLFGQSFLNYSGHDLPELNEQNLNENIGITVPPGASYTGILMPYWYTDSSGNRDINFVTLDGSPVDWDMDGDIELSVNADLNYLPPSAPVNNSPSPRQTLSGHNDWANLIYNFRETLAYGEGMHGDIPATEITQADLDWMQENITYPTCAWDSDVDNDVDGKDLANFIQDFNESDLESFALDFGKADCRAVTCQNSI